MIQYCDINKEYSKYYFSITIAYVGLTLLVPMVIIFFCNILVIANIFSAKKKRENVLNENMMLPINMKISSENILTINRESTPDIRRNAFSKDYSASSFSLLNNNNKNKRKPKKSKSKDSHPKTTRILLAMSFSFSILNLPYFVSWSTFFIKVAFNERLYC